MPPVLCTTLLLLAWREKLGSVAGYMSLAVKGIVIRLLVEVKDQCVTRDVKYERKRPRETENIELGNVLTCPSTIGGSA